MGLDLGNLINTAATTFINAKFGQTAVAGPSIAQMAQPGYNEAAPLAIPQSNVGNITGYDLDIVREPPGKGYVWDFDANCGTGKLRKKRRRRHRNLATRGDIKDLSALKGVLGMGKLLETWIATHS